MIPHLLPLIPEHHIYVEPFGGAAALLFAKDPSPVEVYNDIDSGLVHFFRTLRDPDMCEAFIRLVSISLYSREEYQYCKAHWQEAEGVEKAYRWFVVAKQSFSGLFGKSWTHSVNQSRRGMSGPVSRWLSTIERLPEIVERLRCIQVEHLDFRQLIRKYDTQQTFFYIDPPYIQSTRRAGKYAHELAETDHQELCQLLLSISGSAIVSGYEHPVYGALEDAGWICKRVDMVSHAVGKVKGTQYLGAGGMQCQKRTECLWVSPTISQ